MRDPDEIEAAIEAMLKDPNVMRCRPFGAESPGPQRDVLGWQDEAGEECQVPLDEWTA